MGHKIATVEIEFDHNDALDGDVVLREHLEAMIQAMNRKRAIIGDAHYHLLPVRITIGEPRPKPRKDDQHGQ